MVVNTPLIRDPGYFLLDLTFGGHDWATGFWIIHQVQARKRYLRKLAEVRYLGLGGWREDNKRKTHSLSKWKNHVFVWGWSGITSNWAIHKTQVDRFDQKSVLLVVLLVTLLNSFSIYSYWGFIWSYSFHEMKNPILKQPGFYYDTFHVHGFLCLHWP